MSVRCAKRKPAGFVGAAARDTLVTITPPAAASEALRMERRLGLRSIFDISHLLRRKGPFKGNGQLLKRQGDIDVRIQIIFGADNGVDRARGALEDFRIIARFKQAPKSLRGQ